MKKFGRNQQIGVGAILAPFAVSSTALFLDKATFAEWASFEQFLIPLCLTIVLGLGAAVKIKASKEGGEK